MPIDLSDPYRGNLLYLLPIIYIIPSYVIHIVVIYIMWFSKSSSRFKNNSFYQIYTMQSINNVIYSILQYYKFRAINAAIFLPLYDKIPTRSFLLTFVDCIAYHTFGSQNLLDFWVSFNRASALFLQHRYKNFWKFGIKIVIVSIFVLPIQTWWHLWITDISKELFNSSNYEMGWYISQRQPENVPWQDNGRNLFFFAALSAFFSFLLNIYVAFELRKRIKNDKVSEEDRSQDVKLFIFTLFVFFNQICSAWIQTTFYLTDSVELQSVSIRIQSFVTDINCLGPLWIIIALNKYLRAELNQLFCKNVNNKETTVTAVSMATSKAFTTR